MALCVVVGVVPWACTARPASGPKAASDPETVDFITHIAPILKSKCLKCHGPDKKPKGAFRVDSAELFFLGGETSQDDEAQFRFITPGDASADGNFFLDLLDAEDPEQRMPPPKEKNPVTEKELEWLFKWVDQGAAWPDGLLLD